MSATGAVALLLVLAVLMANLPFVNERLFVVGPRRSPKALGWRLLEPIAGRIQVGRIGVLLEARQGQVHAQGWQFYAVVGCLFLVLAFPGFVWRHLRRRRA